MSRFILLTGKRFTIGYTPIPLLLNTYSAYAAYSVRQLNNTATNCMRIRRSSDNTEQDIGFSNGWVNEDAVATFCAGTSGFIAKWYDQSGNDRPMVQNTATNQMLFYDGSTVTKYNGKPGLYGDPSRLTWLQPNQLLSWTQPFQLHVVAEIEDVSTAHTLLTLKLGSPSRNKLRFSSIFWQFESLFELRTINTGQYIWQVKADGASSYLKENLTTTYTGNVGVYDCDHIRIGGNTTAIYEFWQGHIHEVIIRDTGDTSGADVIEANQNAAFSVYLPPLLLDTYPAFAAYSVRQLSNTATNCMRVREANGNTEADIGFSNGWVDEAAIAAHCGAFNGFVTKWYDQSGNARDASNVTAGQQPQIYNGSAVLQQNGKPALTKVDTATNLVTSAWTEQVDPYTFFTIMSTGADTNNSCFGSLVANQTESYYLGGTNTYRVTGNLSSFDGGVDHDSSQIASTILYNGASSVLRVNGNEDATGTLTGAEKTTGLYVCNVRFLNSAAETTQEVIKILGDQTANFSAIESDINTAFGVY